MSKLFEDIVQGFTEARAFMEGDSDNARITIPDAIDVRRIRGKVHMTQQQFADAFGLSVDAVRHWEAGRRCPESAARALLLVIDHDAETVKRALASAGGAVQTTAKLKKATRSTQTQKATAA